MKRKILFSLISFAVFFILLETAGRLAEIVLAAPVQPETVRSGWQSEFFSHYFDWHEPDPDLLWRFRSGLDNPLLKTNSDHLLGDEIEKPKPEKTFRVLILGDSSPVGLGLKSRRQGFDNIFEYMLENELAGTGRAEVINAAVSGYTSEQIGRFMEKKGWGYQPDLVVVYCGNNDASVSGPLSDSALLAGQVLVWPRTLLDHLAFYRLAKNLLGRWTASDRSPGSDLAVRVSPDRFYRNLSVLADGCRTHHCPLVLLKPPVPLLWPAGLQFKVLTHISDPAGQLIFPDEMIRIIGRKVKYCFNEDFVRELYGEADIYTEEVFNSAYDDPFEPAKAINYYAAKLDEKPDDPLLLNNLGVSFWENGQYREADHILKSARARFRKSHGGELSPAYMSAGAVFLYNLGINHLALSGVDLSHLHDSSAAAFVYLDSARQADYFSLRIKNEYWQRLDSLGALDGVFVADLSKLFYDNGGEKLFIDHCHPTPEGHRLIALTLLKIVRDHSLL